MENMFYPLLYLINLQSTEEFAFFGGEPKAK
jgi:hypothetical protein